MGDKPDKVGFFRTLGRAVGVLTPVEDSGAVSSSSTFSGLEGVPQLSEAEQDALIAREVERDEATRIAQIAEAANAELAAEAEATMPVVTRPSAAPEAMDMHTPDAIIQVVDASIADASEPAFSNLMAAKAQFLAQFGGEPPPGVQPLPMALGMQGAMTDYTPGHSLWDLDEVLRSIADLRAVVEADRDEHITHLVSALEQSAVDKTARAQELRAEADRLEAEAKAEQAEAAHQRTAITAAASAALAHMAEKTTKFTADRAAIQALHPDAQPEEPPGNVRPS